MQKSLVLIHAANPVMVLSSEEAGWVDVVVWDGMGVDKLVVVLVALPALKHRQEHPQQS